MALPSGAGATTYLYEGNTVKVTDPSGRWKKYTTDAFGQLIQVDEPKPGGGTLTTTYTYNLAGKMTQVSMPRGGITQTRTFVYDATTQSRLLSETLPETGTTTYTYYNDGKLYSKTDARNKRLTYGYDIQGRLTSATKFDWNGSAWVNAGSAVSMIYDTAPITGTYPVQVAKGLLASVNGETYEYNWKGRVSKKTIPGGTAGGLSASFTWGQFGELLTMQHPKTAIYGSSAYTSTQYEQTLVSFAYDVLGRPLNSGANHTTSGIYGYGNQTMAHSAQYNAAGQLTSVALINGTQTRTYNTLGQMTRLTVPAAIDIEYRFSATANDGRATGQKNWMSGEELEYTYDSLARLTKAETVGAGGWGQAFGYDDWGNLYSKSPTKGSVPPLSVAIDGWTNRITGTGFGYDGAGNMTSMPVSGGGTQTLTYDHQGRVTTMTNPGGTESYVYDAANQRVVKTAGGATIYSFWSPMGQLLGAYKLKTYDNGAGGTVEHFETVESHFYFGGQRVARRLGSVAWSQYNHNAAGAVRMDRTASVGDGSRYFPYGEDRSTAPDDAHKFATYYRDAGSGLDYAVNRYYSSTYGRFTSADPYRVSGGPSDPGSWNRYSYVGGDPVNKNDPTGLSYNWIWSGGGYGAEVMADLYGPLGGSGGGGGGWCPAVFGWAPGTFCQLQVALPIAAIFAGFEEQTEPDCEIQLKYSDVSAVPGPGDITGNHAFLAVVGRTGGWRFIEGLPENTSIGNFGNLVINTNEITLGSAKAKASQSGTTLRGGNEICDKVDLLDTFSADYMRAPVKYNGSSTLPWDENFGPNSNSLIRYLLNKAGLLDKKTTTGELYFPRPWNTPGWNHKINNW